MDLKDAFEPGLREAVERLIRKPVDAIIASVEAWDPTRPLAALALNYAGETREAMGVANALGLPADDRDARISGGVHQWDFWNALDWPVELSCGPSPERAEEETWALIREERRVADRLVGAGVEWPPTFIVDRVARRIAMRVREIEHPPVTDDFLVFAWCDVDPKEIERSAVFAVGSEVVDRWRPTGVFAREAPPSW